MSRSSRSGSVATIFSALTSGYAADVREGYCCYGLELIEVDSPSVNYGSSTAVF